MKFVTQLFVLLSFFLIVAISVRAQLAEDSEHIGKLPTEEEIDPMMAMEEEAEAARREESEPERLMGRRWGRGWGGYGYGYPSYGYGYPYYGYGYGYGYPAYGIGYGRHWGRW
ncbi:hypothetical protein CSUI_002630 [Cystoisospora suis]|uniref:Transmembrane protein n=1 Tax=Cystoisospora suis TaxID=483139 RepID=A0A2C6L8I1_9APIC|nr:hypothetical protein CSUI_002630 [Cystoisospora suis]